MKAVATVLSNNILFRGKKENIRISPMKLQKLLYYVCVKYVKATGEMPISEQFEVWQYGPVLPSVYEAFRRFGSNPITKYSKDANGYSYRVSEDNNPILRAAIETVWGKYKRKTGIELSKMTHQPNSGWYRAFSERREKITTEDMKNDKTDI